MGAEHSQQRAEADGREVFEGDFKLGRGASAGPTLQQTRTTPSGSVGGAKRRTSILRQNTASSNGTITRHTPEKASPTTSELSRASPPLSVCSDLPYISYTDRPIGDSPKIRSKPHSVLQNSAARAANRKSHPSTGAKPKRPQSTTSAHSIVIVKPGARDSDFEVDPDLARLHSIPQFLPVLRNSIASATFTRDSDVQERLQSTQHLQNICNRMQMHLNVCATSVASEQNHLVERTKIVSNSITTLFASFVDMQKTYAAYAEQFAKIRGVSQQLSRCNALLNDNIASLEAINNFLDVEDRLEPFVWRTDDNKMRGEAEGAAAAAAASADGSGRRLKRL